MNDFVSICKRENNSKRNYLVLNKLQCKHVPSSPSVALSMFKDLANQLPHSYTFEDIVCVGFAETATAIGLEVAKSMGYDYIHTTRELSVKEFYNFSEEHSHATEQKLALSNFEEYDRMLFVEDEVTTGKTILNIIDVLEKHYPHLKYGVASILNGMTDEQLNTYKNRDIDVFYLSKIDNSSYSDKANSVVSNGVLNKIYDGFMLGDLDTIKLNSNLDTRHITDLSSYNSELSNVKYFIGNTLLNLAPKKSKVCVIGTEEFMYPAIAVGMYLEGLGYDVVSHSTTRSPIEVSREEGYPLHSRVELPSVYDKDRSTFIYNLDEYDAVLVLTENLIKDVGIGCLVKALRVAGNKVIKVFEIGARLDEK